jgi:hypothetical protein
MVTTLLQRSNTKCAEPAWSHACPQGKQKSARGRTARLAARHERARTATPALAPNEHLLAGGPPPGELPARRQESRQKIGAGRFSPSDNDLERLTFGPQTDAQTGETRQESAPVRIRT